jgi:hypothetical protein
MSNRAKWAHRHRPKPTKWPERVALVVALMAIGCFFIYLALEGVSERILWNTRFSARFGTFIVQPTASLLLPGAFFILLGVYAWCVRR